MAEFWGQRPQILIVTLTYLNPKPITMSGFRFVEIRMVVKRQNKVRRRSQGILIKTIKLPVPHIILHRISFSRLTSGILDFYYRLCSSSPRLQIGESGNGTLSSRHCFKFQFLLPVAVRERKISNTPNFLLFIHHTDHFSGLNKCRNIWAHKWHFLRWQNIWNASNFLTTILVYPKNST